jgi:hypothetical protein
MSVLKRECALSNTALANKKPACAGFLLANDFISLRVLVLLLPLVLLVRCLIP